VRNPPSNFELQSPETQQGRLLAALHAAKSGTWKWDILEDRVTWDEPLAAIYGVDIGASAKTANEFISFVHPDDRSRIAGLLQSVLENGTDAEYEFRTLLPDGKVTWIYDRSKLIRDESGRPLYMIGACLDVTARKLAEQALINSETRLALATSAAELGIWDWDLTTNEMLYSPRAKEIYGFALELPVTHGQVRAATHPEDLPRTSRMAKNALDPSVRSQEPYEYRIIRPDGSVRWVLAHGQVVFEPAGEASRAVRYVGTIQDITVRRQTETALRDSESRLRLAVDAGRMAIWEYDVATESMLPSPELNKLLGFPTDATPSLEALRSGYHPAEQNLVRNAGAEALARGERFFEVEYRLSVEMMLRYVGFCCALKSKWARRKSHGAL
jgi:PAS domain S-box-containing protein